MFLAQNTDPKKNDKDILKEVLEETNKKEKEANLKNLKQIWKPAHKPFFDQECWVNHFLILKSVPKSYIYKFPNFKEGTSKLSVE